jgi:hypothetical protein
VVSTTDEKIARENRLRLFRDDAARAKEEAAEAGLAARKNMSRLRELRLAKEAEIASAAQDTSTGKPARPARRR